MQADNLHLPQRSDSFAKTLLGAVRYGELNTLRDFFARDNPPTVEEVNVAVGVAASIDQKVILAFLLGAANASTSYAAADGILLKPQMPMHKSESLLYVVAKRGYGDIAVSLLTRFSATYHELLQALPWLARHGASEAVGAIVEKLCSADEEPKRKRRRRSVRKDAGSNLKSSMLDSPTAEAPGDHGTVVKELVRAAKRNECSSPCYCSFAPEPKFYAEHKDNVIDVLLHQHKSGAAALSTATIDTMVLMAAALGKAEAAHERLSARPRPHPLNRLLIKLIEAQCTAAASCILKELKAGTGVSDCTSRGGRHKINGTADGAIMRAVNVGLASAADEGDTRAVELLLSENADANAFEGLPLRRAAARGCSTTIKMLLDAKACVSVLNDEPLKAAARARHADAVLVLVERGADATVLTDDILADGAALGEMEWVKLLLRLNGALNRQAALSCVCKNAARKGRSRKRIIKHLLQRLSVTCKQAKLFVARVTDGRYLHQLNLLISDSERALLPACCDRLVQMTEGLRHELHLAKEPDGRLNTQFRAAVIECADAALQLVSDINERDDAQQESTLSAAADRIGKIFDDGERAALKIATRDLGYELDPIFIRAQRSFLSDHHFFHHFHGSKDFAVCLMFRDAAVMRQKVKAFDMAFELIEKGVVPAKDDVDNLVRTATHLGSPKKHLPRVSMLFAVFGASVVRAIEAGIRYNVLVQCVSDRSMLEGTGTMGAWAWHKMRLRWRFRNLLELYEEVTMRVGNQGYLKAMHHFHDVANML